MKRCYKCGKEWVSDKKQPSFKEFCDNCTAYLHCCRNCRFHDPHAHNQCKIPTTEWVGDREGPSFCEDFEFADTTENSADAEGQQQARDGFQGLFGDEEGDAAQGKGPSTLDDLFSD